MISVNKQKIPLFSVIICTFNRAYLLPRAVKSLLEQKEKDFEVIIVDDGSDDDTFQLCSDLCRKHSNFKYIFHQNRGHSQSRNVGILAASGIYVTFLDSDDEYTADHLLIRKSIVHDYPHLDLIYGGVQIIGDEYVPDANSPEKKIHLKDCVIGGTFVFKKESAVNLGGFANLKYADDYDFYNRAVAKNLKIAKIDYPSYIYYRDSADSICNNLGGDNA